MVDSLRQLSVVIIARNEADNMARAIKSVVSELERWPQTEVLLVDSASTDGTVEIAKRYPINIVRLDPEWFLSASAGRHIGMRYTSGELILYLDGDMELAPGWLERAVPFIQEHPEVAGVTGYFRNVDVHDGQIVGEEFLNRSSHGNAVEVTYFGGAALYRRSALEEVGGFHPYLVSYEEPELCMRLRHAGHRLMRLPRLICTHYGPTMNSWEYCTRRLRTGLWVGIGQVLRYHLKSGLFWMFPRELCVRTLGYLGVVLISIGGVLLAVLLQNARLLAMWVLLASVILIAFWIRKRSLRKVLLSVFLQGGLVCSAVRGFLMAPRPPANYPTDAEVVQTQCCRESLA